MNSVSSIKIDYENLRSVSFDDITNDYIGLGLPFANPARQIKVTNDTDVNIIISFNGVDDKDIIITKSGFVYDYASNKAEQAGNLEQSAGVRMYIKAEDDLPTEGKCYLTLIYASQV